MKGHDRVAPAHGVAGETLCLDMPAYKTRHHPHYRPALLSTPLCSWGPHRWSEQHEIVTPQPKKKEVLESLNLRFKL